MVWVSLVLLVGFEVGMGPLVLPSGLEAPDSVLSVDSLPGLLGGRGVEARCWDGSTLICGGMVEESPNNLFQNGTESLVSGLFMVF